MSEDKNTRQDPDELVVCNIMRSPDGRAYMFRKLQSCSVFETMFSDDPIKHAFNAGLRESGVQLNRELMHFALSDYLKMIEENQ